MKIYKLMLLLLLLLSGLHASKAQDFYYSGDVKIFRAGRDKEFRDANESPLTNEEFPLFNGLNYYEVNPKYRFTAKLVKTPNEQSFEAETSNGKTRSLVKYGYLEFNMDNQKLRLNVYQTVIAKDNPNYKEAASSLFLPFKDLTNKTETYGGGRYLDFRIPESGVLIIDFNLAYNPSCAYGKKYSCFLVPKQNFLNVEIKAGEKLYRSLSKLNLTK